jgi:hypothetical protein
LRGASGDYHRNPPTESSKLFISPLIGLLCFFGHSISPPWRGEISTVDRLADTETSWDIHLAIEHFSETVRRRPWEAIPH